MRSSSTDQATIVAAGITVHEALKAARIPEEQGIAVRVIDAYSIKPIDEEAIRQAAEKTGAVISVEDHYPEGGLGDAVANILVGRKVVYRKLAVNSTPRSGTPEELLEPYGISASRIVEAIKEAIKEK